MPKRKKKPVPVHYIIPDEIHIADIEGKDKGLVATVDLPKNSRLPYLGKEITQDTYDNFVRRSEISPEKKWTEYIMGTTKKPKTYIDAHPRYKDSHSWLASRVNEPSPRQKANMVIRYENKLPVLVTVKRIPAGTELRLHYGDDFVRNYDVGKPADKPDWLK